MVGEPWRLSRFEDRLDEWIGLEDPPVDLRLLVTTWILSRMEDPFAAARREPDFANLWTAVIPGSIHGPHSVVVCSYWVSVAERTIICERFGSLSYPV